LYLFPDGRFVPPWTRLMAAGWALLVFFTLYFPDAGEGRLALRPYSEWPVLLQLLLLLLWAGSGIYAQIYRYVRVSSPVQRQQAKWAVFGLTAAVLGPFIYFLPFFMRPAAAGPGVSNIFYQRIGAAFFAVSLVARLGGLILFTLALLVFPLSFAIAVLRYRLWDIDILINRTLVYGALTGVLALVYLVSVVLLQALFRALTGQGDDVAVIVSTLAIAGLFQPLRRRIQVAIDRRFYRRKYDAERVLESFGATLREEVDLDRLTGALLVVVEETLQPAHVSLWLREQGE
ncbi:MAG TPA: hypothetical protein VER55_02950, partial [Ardenticatenaceae bacterium]|nr:hypothetical protein [Ardenticatenaceae bacterium]